MSFRRSARTLALVAVLGVAAGGSAATFTVTDGPTFQSALEAASLNSEADTISMAAPSGVITLSQPLLYKPGAGTPFGADTSSLTIEGNGQVLQGQLLVGDPILTVSTVNVSDTSSELRLHDLTITGGPSRGLLVETNDAAVVLDTVVVSNNSVTLNVGGWAIVGGGGAALWSRNGPVTITGSRFEGNSFSESVPAMLVGGGGLFVGAPSNTVTLEASVFTQNALTSLGGTSFPSGGGGVAIAGRDGAIEVTGCEFGQNQAMIVGDSAGGGGLAVLISQLDTGLGATAPLSISESSFHDNTVAGSAVDADLGGVAHPPSAFHGLSPFRLPLVLVLSPLSSRSTGCASGWGSAGRSRPVREMRAS